MKEEKPKVTEIDHFIIKIILILFVSVFIFLMTLIVFKYAIENKLIFKLSNYI